MINLFRLLFLPVSLPVAVFLFITGKMAQFFIFIYSDNYDPVFDNEFFAFKTNVFPKFKKGE